MFKTYYNIDKQYGIKEEIIDGILNLCNMPPYAPGTLLGNHDVYSKSTQLGIISSIFNKIKPKYVLETGTESGMFCYFIKCIAPEVNVITFGMNEGHNTSGDHRSTKCTNYLNQQLGNYIEFIEGDSRVTLTNFNTDKCIDFAWIDGGHIHDVLLSDLKNCGRLGIKHICVDDYNMFPEFRGTIQEFITNYPNYKIETVTNDIRGVCYLTKE